MSNKELAEGLHKPITGKSNKQKVYSSFMNNIWSADLFDMQLVSKFNKGLTFLLCVIDIFTNYAWVIPLKDKKGIAITNVFQKILDESNRKPNKIRKDKAGEFYNKSMTSWLEKKCNTIEVYSIQNDRKYLVARFIRTLRNKIYK